jgi:acetoin utilization protein AcuB
VIALDLISDSIPSVSMDDIGSKVLTLMEIFRVSHLPVVSGKEYFGIISDKDIFDAENFDDKIENYIDDHLMQPYVHSDQHIFEVIGVAIRMGVSVVPVLAPDHSYLGVISRNELSIRLSELFSAAEPGGIIVLEMTEASYSLSQIAQIIEGNEARILSLYVSKPSHSTTALNVTIKVNKVDLSGIIQTFTRYDYVILATYMDQSQIKNLFDDRYDQFIRYINV